MDNLGFFLTGLVAGLSASIIVIIIVISYGLG